jgi:hypothetical protein
MAWNCDIEEQVITWILMKENQAIAWHNKGATTFRLLSLGSNLACAN